MTLDEYNKYKPKILNNFVAIQWLKEGRFNDLHIPISYWKHRDLSKGRPCIGKVLDIGPEVVDLNKGDVIEFNEYAADAGMILNEDRVYFVEERDLNFIIKSKLNSVFLCKN